MSLAQKERYGVPTVESPKIVPFLVAEALGGVRRIP